MNFILNSSRLISRPTNHTIGNSCQSKVISRTSVALYSHETEAMQQSVRICTDVHSSEFMLAFIRLENIIGHTWRGLIIIEPGVCIN